MKASVECLAVIPARGGSKGVPRKNITDVGGLPLLGHAIRAAQAARRITRVVVSTDDSEIASVAERFGAQPVARPAEISGDTATSESAVLHALEVLRQSEGYTPELVMLVQCTSPLTTAADLDGLVEALDGGSADSAFLAVPFYHFLWNRDAEGMAHGINHEGKQRKRRQDLAPQFLESGAAYVMRTQLFCETRERFCGRLTLHVVDDERCLEIDSPIDVAKAEAAVRFLATRHKRELLPTPLQALIMDFDGVLTDNAVLVAEDGTETVRCDRGDGLGLGQLAATGVRLLILSKEQNPVVSARARKLKIECLQGVDHKLAALVEWAERTGVDLAQSVYIGNDVNDLECMRRVGCAVAPRDAHPEARRAAALVLDLEGGRGAVRELCDLVLGV